MKFFTRLLNPIANYMDKLTNYNFLFSLITNNFVESVRLDFSEQGLAILGHINMQHSLSSEEQIQKLLLFLQTVVDDYVLSINENVSLENLMDSVTVFDMLFYSENSRQQEQALLLALELDHYIEEYDPYGYTNEIDNAKSHIKSLYDLICDGEIDYILSFFVEMQADDDPVEIKESARRIETNLNNYLSEFGQKEPANDLEH